MSDERATGSRRRPSCTRVARRMDRVGWGSGAAGGLVTFVSVGFLIPVFFKHDDSARLALINGPLIAVYVLLVGLAISRHDRRHLTETLGWLVGSRAPDEREHRLTLGLAMYCVKTDALAWAGGAILFASSTCSSSP